MTDMGAFATGQSQQQVRPCRLRAKSGSNSESIGVIIEALAAAQLQRFSRREN
jgi:hypothetical protein